MYSADAGQVAVANPRKGFMVTPISVRDIVDMYEYRKVLECFAAEKVAQSATPDQIAEDHLKNKPTEVLSPPCNPQVRYAQLGTMCLYTKLLPV